MGAGRTTSAKKHPECGNFQHPNETRTFEKGKLELIRLGGQIVGRLTLEPGWRWLRT
jgi:hypothetical protein